MWFSWNPENRTDWVFQRFVLNPEPEDVSLLVNYHDNGIVRSFCSECQEPMNNQSEPCPACANDSWDWKWESFFPEGLDAERQRDERVNPDFYAWIWLGEPADEGVERIVLPFSLVQKCVDAFSKYGHLESGWVHAGLDIADTGPAHNAFVVRRGPVVTHAERWRGKSSETVQHVHELTAEHTVNDIYYDSGGVGAFARLFFDQIEEQRTYLVHAENFGASVREPERQFDFQMDNSQMFARRNAQLAWGLRMRAMATERLLDGDETVNPELCLFISPKIPRLDVFLSQLAQPRWRRSITGKIEIVKADENEPSPDMYDATALAFAFDSTSGLVSRHV